jgi:sterol desaturase/sphingolipid hydroxylase (fatty acid hydroxylase superfamily)
MNNEAIVRFVAFAGVLAALTAWELLAPRRPRSIGRTVRWPSNIGVVVLDTVLVRFLFPSSVIGLALACEAHSWGLFQVLALPAWATIPLAFVAMDLAIYLQHVMFH